jgi:hypothetical protein
MMLIIFLTPAVIAVHFMYSRVIIISTVGFHVSPVKRLSQLPGRFYQTLISVSPTSG